MLSYFIKSLIRLLVFRLAVHTVDKIEGTRATVYTCTECERIYLGKPDRCKCDSVSFTGGPGQVQYRYQGNNQH